MVSAGIQTINLTIGHVSQCCQRVPQARVTVREKPLDALEFEPGGDVRIFVHITIVVEIDEAVAKALAKNDPDDDRQAKADTQRNLAILSRTDLRRDCRHFLNGRWQESPASEPKAQCGSETAETVTNTASKINRRRFR